MSVVASWGVYRRLSLWVPGRAVIHLKNWQTSDVLASIFTDDACFYQRFSCYRHMIYQNDKTCCDIYQTSYARHTSY